MTAKETTASRQQGFTLIELSIVLVIIGLVVGGVMVGRTLIQQAEIRAAVTRIQQFDTAYRTFQTKYGCIAGDCANATDFFGMNYVVEPGGCPPSGGAGNGNGNGDGVIKSFPGYESGSWWHCETVQAHVSLSMANLLPSKLLSPCSPGNTVFIQGLNDSCGYLYADDLYNAVGNSNTSSITFAGYTADFTVRGAALSPVQARLTDEKIDDGKPGTGRFRGLNAALSSGGAIVANSCQTSGAYNLNEDYTCRALYYLK